MVESHTAHQSHVVNRGKSRLPGHGRGQRGRRRCDGRQGAVVVQSRHAAVGRHHQLRGRREAVHRRGRRRDVAVAGLVREGAEVGGCGARELQRHYRGIRARGLTAFALVVAMVLVATTSGSGEARRIRLCADPANPPFSSRHATEPGFEVEIARAIADAIGAELSVHWFPTTREIAALRQLYEGRCDLLMGVPVTSRYTEDKPRLLFTVPYYVMTQVVVAPTVGGVASIEGLQGKLVGVQAMTLSDQLAYERGWNRKVYLKPEELFAALVGTEVDAIVVE